MLDIMKWFKRWGVEDMLELSSDVMKDVISEDSLINTLRMKCLDAKMSKLINYISNVNLQYKVKMPKHIPHLTTP